MTPYRPRIAFLTLLFAFGLTPLASAAGVYEPSKPSAAWNVVPWQNITEPTPLGVVAFHPVRVKSVTIEADGSELAVITEATPNPRFAGLNRRLPMSEIREYWFTLDPAEFEPGTLRLTATIVAEVGQPRTRTIDLLVGVEAEVVRYDPAEHRDIIWLGDQLQRTDAPTLVIELPAGRYEGIPGGRYWKVPGWVVVRPAPGVSREEVVIVPQGGRNRTKNIKLKLKNVTIDATNGRSFDFHGGAFWVDGCDYTGPGDRSYMTAGGYHWRHAYWTDSTIRLAQVALRFVLLARNCLIVDAAEDAFKFVNTTVNCTVLGVLNNQPGYHADVFQYFSDVENVIVYGLKARVQGVQGIGIPAAENCAFVGLDLDNAIAENNVGQVFQFANSAGINYTLIADSVFHGRSNFREAAKQSIGTVIRDSSFNGVDRPNGLEGVDGVVVLTTPDPVAEAVAKLGEAKALLQEESER